MMVSSYYRLLVRWMKYTGAEVASVAGVVTSAGTGDSIAGVPRGDQQGEIAVGSAINW